MKDQVGTGFLQNVSSLVLLVGFFFLASCGDELKPDEAAVEVSVSPVVERKIKSWDSYQGRFRSPQVSHVLPRVNGLVVSAPFTEGSIVEKDDVLFAIDDRPFLAEYQSKDALFQKSQAVLSQKQTKYNRFKKLNIANAISADEFEKIEAEYKEAKADLEIAKSEKEISKLNLEWTKVRTPIAGKVGKKLVTIGNLVNSNANSSTILTSVTSVDPMYVSVDIPEREYFELRKNQNSKILCQARLENQEDFSYRGEINFIDNHVNKDTGTIEIRCSFPNPQGLFIEGLYTDVRIMLIEPFKTMLINDSSILTDQNSRFVYYLDDQNIVQRANIELGTLFNNVRSVPSGLKSGWRIITDNLQKIKIGQAVKISEVVPVDLTYSSQFIVE